MRLRGRARRYWQTPGVCRNNGTWAADPHQNLLLGACRVRSSEEDGSVGAAATSPSWCAASCFHSLLDGVTEFDPADCYAPLYKATDGDASYTATSLDFLEDLSRACVPRQPPPQCHWLARCLSGIVVAAFSCLLFYFLFLFFWLFWLFLLFFFLFFFFFLWFFVPPPLLLMVRRYLVARLDPPRPVSALSLRAAWSEGASASVTLHAAGGTGPDAVVVLPRNMSGSASPVGILVTSGSSAASDDAVIYDEVLLQFERTTCGLAECDARVHELAAFSEPACFDELVLDLGRVSE